MPFFLTMSYQLLKSKRTKKLFFFLSPFLTKSLKFLFTLFTEVYLINIVLFTIIILNLLFEIILNTSILQYQFHVINIRILAANQQKWEWGVANQAQIFNAGFVKQTLYNIYSYILFLIGAIKPCFFTLQVQWRQQKLYTKERRN